MRESAQLTKLAPAMGRRQEIFDNDHRVVSQKGASSGRFTFSSAEAGDHKICFTPSSNSGRAGWLSAANANGGIRLTLDLVIGETNEIESTDTPIVAQGRTVKLSDIATRVKDLNARLRDVKREQVFQRVRTCSFSSYFRRLFFRAGFPWLRRKKKREREREREREGQTMVIPC